ncbi:MAG: hypothetical protein ACRDZX_05265 [Acidimicrobiales bacterium]
MQCPRVPTGPRLIAALGAVATVVAFGLGAASHPPPAGAGLVGRALSGLGSSFAPPRGPTLRPYTPDCHHLIDPAFRGKCVVASGRTGTVAGVVEQERGAFGTQERDLVWHRQGRHWALAQVHVFENPGRLTSVWSDDVGRDGDRELVFAMPAGRPGFASELDLVEGTGEVAVYRFLGGGFAIVPVADRLVTYVPGWVGRRRAGAYYQEILIGFARGRWRILSIQRVPYADALARHRGAFYDSAAVAATS